MSDESRISTAWISGLTTDEKPEFVRLLRNNFTGTVMDRFQDILIKSVESVEVKEASMSQYDSPSWAYRQAHLNGYKEAINFVNSLFKGLT